MENSGLVSFLARLIGCTEPALTLLISLLLGYPIAFFHRKYLYGKAPNLQHIYFIVCGLGLCYFNYGWDTLHSVAAVSITYGVLKVLGGNLTSLLIVFTYTMLHLLIGYWATATATYDIKWTMPQCVLTLRLIGLAFNVYDGQQPEEKLSSDNKSVALRTVPSLLEVFGHSYFPSSFLVGPQLPLKRYHDFVELKLEKKENPKELPDTIVAGRNRLCLGIMYLSIYQLGSMYLSDDYITSEEYSCLSMWKKVLFFGIWGRVNLYKYISCWLITEGSCIIMGLTYNGVDENGKAKWDGCSNVKLSVFETSTRMNHYIESFNINTNQWVAQYIYKRLKFLNNKSYSYLGTLLFLAVWHGLHSGYYVTFFFEFIVITTEKNIMTLAERSDKTMEFVQKPLVSCVLNVFLRMYTFVTMGYAMIPFVLLKYRRYFPVLKQFYFAPHVICISIIALDPLLKKMVPRSRKEPKPAPSSSTEGEKGTVEEKKNE
ncbi:hypothetical protein RUM43_006728 [Polyplax serrata]|uniref:Lysophospholipid acyltransferase 5 n=1 Tax=Polyplax serrata TaxID=468196 RepID=A0AAN8SA19_POLSC